jgi:hypothetical protein
MDTTIKSKHTILDELRMHTHELRHLGGHRSDVVITCKQGMLWVTQAGDRKDYILYPGEQFSTNTPDKVVVEALNESAMIITKN